MLAYSIKFYKLIALIVCIVYVFLKKRIVICTTNFLILLMTALAAKYRSRLSPSLSLFVSTLAFTLELYVVRVYRS